MSCVVPVEAMHAGCPVIAVDSGGPRETVVHQVTGFLCAASPAEFAAAMSTLIRGVPKEGVGLERGEVEGGRAVECTTELRQRMGDAGRQHVHECFSFDSFTDKLDHIIHTLCSS